MEPQLRPTARVLLLDDTERLLLFRGVDAEGLGFWFPPGGRIEPGESAEAAAVRELREETGLNEVKLGPQVWHRRHLIGWGGVDYDIRERWFLARVSRFEVDTNGFTDEEREQGLQPRWWTLPELTGATERLVPADLADRLARLLRHGPPEEPVEVGI